MTGPPSERTRGLREALVVVVPIMLIGILALSDGGFDLVIRQQAALIVWWLLALGFAFGVVPRSEPPRGWRVAAIGFLALAGLQLMSMAWGTSDDASLAEASRTLGYLGVLALAWCGLGPRSWRVAGDALFVVAAAITAYAVLGRLAPELAGLDDFERSLGTDRLFAPLGYWNGLAAWAAATLGLSLAWSAGSRPAILRAAALALFPVAGLAVYLTYSRGGVLLAALAVALVVGLSRDRSRAARHAAVGAAATAAAILTVRSQPQIATGSGAEGAGWVAVVLLAAMATCWFAARPVGRQAWPRWLRRRTLRASKRRRRSRPSAAGAESAPRANGGARTAIGAVSILVLALVVIAVTAGGDGFGRGGDAAAQEQAFTGSDPAVRLTTAAGNRSAYWSEALDGFAAQPLRGEGPGSFRYRWARFGSEPEQVSDSHSLLFETATELGLVGLAALGIAVAGLLTAAARGIATSRRDGSAVGLATVLTVFLAASLIDWSWELPALAYLGLGSGAVLSMAAATPRPRGRTKPVLDRGSRWALVGLAFAAGAVQVPGIVSSELTRSSIEQRALGFSSAAIASADDAITAAPWSASAYAARAAAELDAGYSEAAARDAREAERREPLESLHHLLLAQVAVEEGRLAGAVQEIEMARRLSPLAVNRLGPPAFELLERIERLRDSQGRQHPAPG